MRLRFYFKPLNESFIFRGQFYNKYERVTNFYQINKLVHFKRKNMMTVKFEDPLILDITWPDLIGSDIAEAEDERIVTQSH